MNHNSTLDAIPESQEERTSTPPTPTPAPESANTSDSHAPVIRTSRAGKKRESLALEKLHHLKHLIQTVDTLVYTELFILYYMDCSFFRLIIRAFAQLVLFSPVGPRGTPLITDRPYMPMIFIPNALCLLLHTFTARPEAGEALRGYLHGGIIMDLIGQKGPISKIHLLLLDLLVLVLQCFMLSVNMKYKQLHTYIRTKEYRNPSSPAVTAERTQQIDADNQHQDHDAEEQGIFRLAGTTSNDIELQDLSPLTLTHNPNPQTSTPPQENEAEDEHQSLLQPPTSTTDDPQQPHLGDHLLHTPSSQTPALSEWLDLHHAGIAITAEFHILDSLRTQYRTTKTRAEMLQATATAFSESSRDQRLASVGDILARAMEPGTQGGGES